MNNSHSAPSASRIFGLDLLRAIAILVVVIGHGKPILQAVGSGFPYVSLPDGVEIFFVLSGFLIGQILMRERISSGRELFVFWSRRWLRTLPLYYVFLLLNLLFSHIGCLPTEVKSHNWQFWLFVQNFYAPFQGFFWESWSLAIEEWFYLLYPLLFLAVGRLFSARNAHALVLFLFLFMPPMLRYWKYSGIGGGFDAFFWDVEFRKIVVLRLDAIGFGIFAAWAKHFFPAWQRARLVSLALFAFVQVFLWRYVAPIDGFYKSVWSFSLLGLCYALLLPAMDAWTVTKMRFWHKIVQFVSKISYSMYLVNLLMFQILLYFFASALTSPLNAWILFAAYLVGTVFCSYCTYRFIEKPFLRLRR